VNYIVIGTDCSGKTSLVNKLSEKLGVDVVKGSSFEHAQCTQGELFAKFLDFTDMDNVIFDRFSYCNAVYAPMYNDFALLSSGQRRIIEARLMYKAIVIYLYADDEVLAARFTNRGDDYVDLERLLKAKQMYEQELESVKYIPVIKFDTGKMSTDEIVEAISSNTLKINK
jgi:broad-specificity NMP kinase